MPRRHPDLADAERLTSELLRQNPDEALQPVSHVAASPQQLHAAAAQDSSIVHLQGIQRVTTGHVENAGDPSQPQVVRWVSRLTEFLRTTAARGVSSMDRVMEDIGMSPMVPSRMSPTPPRSGSRMGQQALMSGQGGLPHAMEISPPEELTSGLAIPATWAQARAQRGSALFEPGELNQLQRLQARSSLLVGSPVPPQPSDGNSTSSSNNLQAEVQRQLDEYSQRQRLEMQRLQQEIFNLRAERDALQEGRRLSVEASHSSLPQSGLALQHGGLGSEGRTAELPGHSQVPGPPAEPADQGARALGLAGLSGLAGVFVGQPSAQALPKLAQVPEGQGALGGGSRTTDLPGHSQVPLAAGVLGGQVQAAASAIPSGSRLGAGMSPPLPGSMPYPKTLPQSFAPPFPTTSIGASVQGKQQPVGGNGNQAMQGSQGTAPSLAKATSSGTTPSQWLGPQATAQGSDPLSILVGGITQLQAAMMKQYDGGELSPEAVKPGTLALPPLKGIDPLTASIDVQDWLEVITSAMSDLSNSSGQWWLQVKALASTTYDLWSRATPLERLTVQPPVETDLERGRWARVNARAASMVMSALDGAVSSEMVARRLTQSTPGLVFRLMTLYQPGGEKEKFLVLAHLQSPPPASSASIAVDSLRTWSRWMRRCDAINLAKPDPTILVKGLTSIVQGVLAGNPQASFRTSLVRSSLKVDVAPDYKSVEDFHAHLLAEMEGLATGAGASMEPPPSTSVVSSPKVRELRAEQGRQENMPNLTAASSPRTPTSSEDKERAAKRSATQCRYFGKTQKGCVRGSKCPFKHGWEGMDSKDRCLTCGGKGHFAKECPTKKGSPVRPPTPRAPTSSTTTTSAEAAARTVKVDESKNQIVEIPAASTLPTSSTTNQASELREVLNEAGKMLKALSAAHVKACQVSDPLEGRIRQFEQRTDKGMNEEMQNLDQCTGLLDSGASHPLRPGSFDEVKGCSKVTVTLAGDGTTQLAQNQMGTILIPQEKSAGVQPIVPLGALITDLGCTLSWSKSSLKLTHPRHGRLRVTLKGRCPEVAVADALRLIKELEEVQLNQLNEQVDSLSARLQMLEEGETRTWDENLKEYVMTGRKELLWKVLMAAPYTKDLPDEVKELVAEGFQPSMGKEYVKALPLSRRERRRLLASDHWVVHLYSGSPASEGDPFRTLNKNGKVLLEIDICSSKLWDMNLVGGIYQCLLWAAASQKIDDILGGPPCRTFSALLHRPRQGFPGPARSPQHPYGLPQLDARRQVQVHRDTALIVKQMILWNIAFVANSGNFVGFLLEHPSAPESYMKERVQQGECPSLWKIPLWKEFQKTFGMHFISYEQGALGHKAVKPTSNGTNYVALLDIDGMKADRSKTMPATMLPSDVLARWASGLRKRVVAAILGPQSLPVPAAVMNEAMTKKMTAEERDLWRQHLLADHQPYRADCATCINPQATGRPHRKVVRRTGYSLAVDLAGPFKHKGRDMDYRDYRYLLVAAFRFPRGLLHVPKPEDYDTLLDVPEEREDEEDDMNLAGLFDFEEERKKPEVMVREEEADLEDEPVPLPEERPEKHAPVEEEKAFGPETMDEAVKELSKPVEMVTIYLSRPLRRRTGAAVLTAVQEICLQLDRNGTPVRNIHTDRAREFGTAQMKAWLAHQQITRTTTSGSEPAGNATAERGVRWYKARARALLRAAGAGPADWPMATNHASATLWRKAFPSSPLFKGRIAAFGQQVWYKAKGYKGVKEKEMDTAINKDLPVRWKRATYRGPSMDVSEGHLLLRDDGGLTLAKGIKEGIKEPEKEDPPLLPELHVDNVDDPGPPIPASRIRGKTPMKMLAVGDEVNEDSEFFEELTQEQIAQTYMMARSCNDVNRGEEQPPALRRLLKKAEVTYTPDIENVLRYHEVNNVPLEVTHTVSLDDVKANISAWEPSARKEFLNLKDNKCAFEVIGRDQLPPGCRIVPGKGVFTVKPDKGGYRRKTRFVACGNYMDGDAEGVQSLYAAGLDASSLRTILSVASSNDGWKVGLTDIRQAFVLAPWIGEPIAIQPPVVAQRLGLASPGEFWLVRQAIYGLRESPAIWASFRDSELKKAKLAVEEDGKTTSCILKPLISDSQVWKIMDVENEKEVMGYLLVYVDDVLIIGKQGAIKACYQWFADRWECDELATLCPEVPLRFLGMELFQTSAGFELGQKGFVQELLRSHAHTGRRSMLPGPRDSLMLTVEEEEALINVVEPVQAEESVLRMAQRRVGELLWLASRTRPDLMYLVSLLSSKVTRDPHMVNTLGERALDYLAETADYRLTFPAQRSDHNIHVYTDSSFAPSSGRSHGSAVVFLNQSPLSWRSARQQLVTLSTAESELIEAVDGTVLGLSCRGLISELLEINPKIVIHLDNQSALALVHGQAGSWRTRHLRLRVHWLREKIMNGEVQVIYEPGTTQRADLGTKPFTKERLRQLVQQWGIRDARPTAKALSAAMEEQKPGITEISDGQVTGKNVGTSPAATTTTSTLTTWIARVAVLCQVCGTKAQEETGLEPTFPWEFYALVLMVAIIAIGIWEMGRTRCAARLARLRLLRDQAEHDMNRRLSRTELDELQTLLGVDPGDLSFDQATRLLDLRTRFGATRTSRRAPRQSITQAPSASSTTRTVEHTNPTYMDVGTQTPEPAFQLMENTPVPRIEIREVIPEGPYYHVPGRNHVHLVRRCWGLRNAGTVGELTMCRCCRENDGRSMYGDTAGNLG